VKPFHADKTTFCAAVIWLNGQLKVVAGYSMVGPASYACFFPAGRRARALIRIGTPEPCLKPESYPEITNRLPYNPSTLVLPSN
jgi:hypothetical protein